MVEHSFGGIWTVEKLNILSDYLSFYTKALKNMHFKKLYIDAFAGTGYIKTCDGHELIPGSARLALQAQNPFDKYCFIEKRRDFACELNALKTEFPDRAQRVKIINDDCNMALKKICTEVDWRYNRALLFLDPYATEVKWDTLATIARTQCIDVWYLVPYHAVNRMLPIDNPMIPSWKERLNKLFGDKNWINEFYKKDAQMSFFEEEKNVKELNVDLFKKYVIKRLKTIFPAVSENPRVLYNSKNSPLFLFCFAVSNPSPAAIKLAMGAADYLLKRKLEVIT